MTDNNLDSSTPVTGVENVENPECSGLDVDRLERAIDNMNKPKNPHGKGRHVRILGRGQDKPRKRPIGYKDYIAKLNKSLNEPAERPGLIKPKSTVTPVKE